MSMQEIYGLHLEMEEVKRILENFTGMKFEGSKLRDKNEADIQEIKKALYDVVNEVLLIKERMNHMELNLQALEQEVARAQTVQSSAVTLLTKLTRELERISAELATKAALSPPEIDTAPLNALIDKLKTSTDVLASAVSDSTDVVPVKEVILNANDPTKPTVSVVMPEVLPENVVVRAETIVDTVDPTSPEPQVNVVVEDAVNVAVPEVPAPAVVDVIETPAEQVNVTVEAPVAVVDQVKAEANVDVVEAVKEAAAVAEVPAEPAAPVAVTEETQPQP